MTEHLRCSRRQQRQGAHLSQITTSLGLTIRRPVAGWEIDRLCDATRSQALHLCTNHIAVSTRIRRRCKSSHFETGPRFPASLAFSPDASLLFHRRDDGTQNLCRVPVGRGRLHVLLADASALRLLSPVRRSGGADHYCRSRSEIYTIPKGKLTRITHPTTTSWRSSNSPRRSTSSSRAKTALRYPGFFTSRLTTCRERSIRRFFVRTVERSGLLRPVHAPGSAFAAKRLRWCSTKPTRLYRLWAEPSPKPLMRLGNKDFQDGHGHGRLRHCAGPWLDPDKLGVGGWSYGGISTDFIMLRPRGSRPQSQARVPHSLHRCMDTTLHPATMNTNWDSHEG